MAERILLVEPDVVLGAVLGEVLRHGGYEVIVVNTLRGQEERMRFASAVILDVDTTGIENELAWLEERQSPDASPRVILVGVQAPEVLPHWVRIQLRRRCLNGLILVRKPFRNEDLLAAVRGVQESPAPRQAKGM